MIVTAMIRRMRLVLEYSVLGRTPYLYPERRSSDYTPYLCTFLIRYLECEYSALAKIVWAKAIWDIYVFTWATLSAWNDLITI